MYENGFLFFRKFTSCENQLFCICKFEKAKFIISQLQFNCLLSISNSLSFYIYLVIKTLR